MRFVLYFTVLMLLACTISADEFDVMEYYGKAGKPACYSNGQAVLPFTQFKGTVRLPGFIQSVVMVTEYNAYDPISGSYYDAKYQPAITSGLGETALYVTHEYQFNEQKNYTVIMAGTSYAILDLYEDVSVLRFDFECPGYLHSCRFVELAIDNCTYDDEVIQVDLHGLGLNNYSQVNITRDLEVVFAREFHPRDFDLMQMPVSRKYFKTGNDSYTVKIPLKSLPEIPLLVNMEVTGCIKELHDVTASMTCHHKDEEPTAAPIAEERVIYECRPRLLDEEPQQICSAVVNLPEEPVPQEPSETDVAFQFLRRLVRFTLRIPWMK
jgi:hypothetical protein